MRCRDCPYGLVDFSLRTAMCEPVYDEHPDEDRTNRSEKFVWCNKVGGKVYSLGHCSDWYELVEEKDKNYSKKKRMNKRERYLKHQNHLKYLERVSCGYPQAVTYEDKIWIKGLGYAENSKPYYKRWYRSKRSSYFKQQSNKAIRRYKGELHKGYQHIHKIYDFWWKYIQEGP